MCKYAPSYAADLNSAVSAFAVEVFECNNSEVKDFKLFPTMRIFLFYTYVYKLTLSTPNQGNSQLEMVQNFKRPADSDVSSSQSNKNHKVNTKWVVEDFCVCMSLTSEIW